MLYNIKGQFILNARFPCSVIRLIQQYLKESNLIRTLQTLQVTSSIQLEDFKVNHSNFVMRQVMCFKDVGYIRKYRGSGSY
jgi:hypothetical protein